MVLKGNDEISFLEHENVFEGFVRQKLSKKAKNYNKSANFKKKMSMYENDSLNTAKKEVPLQPNPFLEDSLHD